MVLCRGQEKTARSSMLLYIDVKLQVCSKLVTNGAPPGVLGIWGEWLFIFRDLGSIGNYFRGAGEQVYSFGDLGSPAKKQNNKGKASILFNFLKFSSASGGIAPQTPLINSKCIKFC